MKKQCFDVILLGMMLPFKNGAELIRLLRSIRARKETPIHPSL
jgi:DNA-binding response OmpR family regulator